MTATDVDATSDDDYDPFLAFNEANGAGTVGNPYPDFVALRRDTPVAEMDLRAMFGLADDRSPRTGSSRPTPSKRCSRCCGTATPSRPRATGR